ncbi:MAG: endolytic transglycosylase MltG [Firmicutes bacterium]|nr:endolytic transglycosylase MltG [Bacillota bacterium]
MKRARIILENRRTRSLYLTAILLLLVVLGTGYLAMPAGSRRQGEVYVRVTAGAGARTIGRDLAQKRLVRSEFHFILWTRILGAEGKLQAGEYKLHPGMTPFEIVSRLKDGRVASRGITIPEGFDLRQISAVLAAAGLVEEDEFLAAANDAAGVLEGTGRAVPPNNSLEGYLFPDTYRIAPGTPVREILRMMVNRMYEKVEPLLEDRDVPLDLDFHQLLTLASIVEKEAQQAEERPLIAGVFLNRLRQRMPLQADPTVKYVLDPAPTRLSLEDVKVDSPYNTYRYPGLPPGPIASPGIEAIMAVLEPSDTDHLYFVARGDGTHIFSRSYREHLDARRRLNAVSGSR